MPMNEFDSPNYTEYTWDKKAEGKGRLLKMLLIFIYISFVGLFFLICYLTRIIPLFALCPVFTWILVFFTWRLVSYDCYFEIKEGYIELGKVKVTKTGRRKSPKLNIHIKECEIGGLVSEGGAELVSVSKTYDYSETVKSPHRIYLIWMNKGVRSAVIFEGTAKSARLISSLCDGAKSLKGQTLHG